MSLQTTFGFRDLWSLGYRRLLPIAPPDAPLHPESALWRAASKGAAKDPRGKAPAVMGADGLWRGMDLTRMEAEEQDLAAWEAWGASVGVRTGQSLVAVDLDCPDRDVARALATRAWDMLGPAPIRFGAKPKALLLYRVEPEAAYDKVRFLAREGAEQAQVVELLTEGRQFVAAGTHPRTGRPYEWPHGLTSYDDLTRIDLATLGEFMDEVSRSWPAAHRLSSGGGEQGARHAPEQRSLTADPDLVRDAIKHLPNPDSAFPHRDDWIAMGAAIKAAMGPALDDEAFDLWEQWSCRWDRPGAEHDPDDARNEWARIKPPYRIGAGYVFAQAERLGGWEGTARQFFAPVTVATAAAPQGVRFGDAEDAAQQRGDTFEVLSLDDIENLPRPRFLVERHIPENSLGFVYGPPGSKKSFLMLDLALHVAYGLPDWHGDLIGARAGANVLYLAAEGSAGIRARVRAWKKAHADRIAACGSRTPAFRLIRQPLNFMDPQDVEKLARTVAEAGIAPLDLVIVDTVSRVLPGADENLQKDMTLFVRACDAVRLSFGASVIGVHHSSKGGDMRGSTVLRGAGDFVFSIDKPDEPSAPSAFVATKQKDIEDGWADYYAFDAVALGEDETSLVPRRTSAPVEAVVETDGPVAELILDAMAAAWARGEPWLKVPKAGQIERGARRRMVADFGMKGDQADGLLALWEKAGTVRLSRGPRDKDGKRAKGYEVANRCVMDALLPPAEGGVFA